MIIISLPLLSLTSLRPFYLHSAINVSIHIKPPALHPLRVFPHIPLHVPTFLPFICLILPSFLLSLPLFHSASHPSASTLSLYSHRHHPSSCSPSLNLSSSCTNQPTNHYSSPSLHQIIGAHIFRSRGDKVSEGGWEGDM